MHRDCHEISPAVAGLRHKREDIKLHILWAETIGPDNGTGYHEYDHHD